MNIRQIKYFLALADELHFWKTSEKVFITQSALSRQIKALENELGFDLFERDRRRRVKLTKAGEFLRVELARITSDFESVARRAAQIAKGEIGIIRIGHPASITFSILPEILSALAEKHPRIVAQMSEVDAVDVDAFLLTHRIDLAFNREEAKADNLATRYLQTENFALVVAADHPFGRKRKINLRALKDEWFVLPSLIGESEHAAQLRAIFAAAGFAPQVRFESDFGATLLGLVAKGLGVSVMPISYAQYLSEKVRFIEIPAVSSLYVIRRTDDKSAALENFMKIIDERTKHNSGDKNNSDGESDSEK